jgi:excisionase family DNA binding protein
MAGYASNQDPRQADGVEQDLGARLSRSEAVLRDIAEHLRLQRIPLETMLTPQEVATKLRVSPDTVKRHIERGELRASRLQGRKYTLYRIRPSDVEAFLNGTTEPAARPSTRRRKLLEIPDIDV